MKFIAKILCVLLIPSMLFITSACEKKQPAAVDLDAVYAEIESTVTLPEFIAIEEKELTDFFGLDPADFKKIIIRIGAESILADEIVICEAKDEEATARIKKGLEEHLQNQINSFKTYIPAEYDKLKDVTVNIKGNYIYYAVSSSAETINGIFNKYFG
jgi:hypothetical protein